MDNTSKKILIVEDDEFLRSITAKQLEKDQYSVITAVDGENAVTLAQENVPDLILLDLLLPGMNGFDVLTKIKSMDTLKNIPVIVFSNLGQKEDLEKAKNLGAVDFLIKANFTLEDVAQKIKSVLGN